MLRFVAILLEAVEARGGCEERGNMGRKYGPRMAGRRKCHRDKDDSVLDGILDNTNTDYCVFGPISKNPNGTFSFGDKLCIDPDQHIYKCQDGIDLDFKKVWNCDNFVIQEQISGKCLVRDDGKYFLGSCDTCLNNTFFNLTDQCLKPNIEDTIGTLLCDEINKSFNTKQKRRNRGTPLCKLMDIQDELEDSIEDVLKPTGLRKLTVKIDKNGPGYDRFVGNVLDRLVGPNDCDQHLFRSTVFRNSRRRRKC
ncbi:hypothetical protein ECANGB1_2680 [Enterospora canceri]|uniref:Uncharacterized protein n=1 Tax=Enterospora canceri TaxID=1081671 RepID=A0A1Y1S9L9_9MICR|nr:hypothetical protein ECANGB1_2680 [Enterospora canceri]